MKKLAELFIVKIPQKYKDELSRETVKVNFYRAEILGKLIIVLELLFLVFSFLPSIEVQYTYLWRYRLMYIFMIAYVMILFVVTNRIKAFLKEHIKIAEAVILSIVGGILIWCALLSVFDQVQGLEGVTYLYVTLATAIIFLLKPFQSGLVYAISLIFYYIMNYVMNVNQKFIYSNVINTSSVIITAFVISLVLYHSNSKDFLKKKVIEKQKDALEKMVLLDPMTGLYNRRGLEEKLDYYFEEAQKTNAFICAFMFDIDYFKGVNDTYGHDKGDEIIRIISEEIIQLAENHDGIGCRYGGDEFSMIIPHTSEKEAEIIEKKFKDIMTSFEIENSASPSNKLSVSCGFYATRANTISDPWELVTGADKALYIIKRDRK